jgi:Ca2+-transporting ATPase
MNAHEFLGRIQALGGLADLQEADRPPGNAGAPLSAALAGEPVRLGPDVRTPDQILEALDLGGLSSPGALSLAPGVALLHGLGAESRAPALRWAHLAAPLALLPGSEPVDLVGVLVVPLAAGRQALRLVGLLRAVVARPGLLEELRQAATREDLVRALAGADAGEEAPLAGAEVLALLGSGPAGLAAAEAARRARLIGPNRIERIHRRSLALRFLEQLWSLFALLLWAGGLLAFLAGLSELGWAVFAVILINGVFSFLQEYRAERAVEALQRLLPHEVTVLRDGREQRAPATALVPGDVIRLAEGDQVPADGHVLDADGLRVDQSLLTGESQPVFKLPVGPVVAPRPRSVRPGERPELVFAGSAVVAGTGTVVVCGTAMATEIGAIAHLTQAVSEEPSPLQRELARVTRVVTALAVTFGAAAFGLSWATGALRPAAGLVFALGVIVANVPEGLLPTLTLALATGVQRLARQRSLVKRLSAVEALGATTVICTDKTGTLTQNRMEARLAWTGGRARALPDGTPEVRALLEAATLASHATAEAGDPTEVALVRAAVAAGVPPEAVRAARRTLATHPFDSFRKRMTLVRAGPTGPVAYAKGAPRELLALSVAWAGPGGPEPLGEAERRAILGEHDRLAREGYRLLAVAVRALPEGLPTAPASAVERDLTFLGFLALWDPPRPEVPEAIATCQRAGLRVIVVTGDDGLTARAIARQIGLPVDTIVSGEELDRLPPGALRGFLTREHVLFARTTPAHKLAIVRELRALGEVVAVTGDGVNDAPALKAADTGVAMGGRGSEVAREAALVVVTDDNFASIVTAIHHGRAIYANIGKFVTYIFASNVPELVPFLAFVFLEVPLALTVMQILAVDLGTDLLPALALGAEPPEPGIMAEPPRRRDARLLDARRLLHAYGFLGMIEAALAMGAFFWTYWLAGWRPGLPMAAEGELYRRATTMTLAGIVAAQAGNVFACRTDRTSVFRVGLFGNRLVLLGIAAEVGLLVVLLAVPPLRRAFGLAPPGCAEWLPLLAFPAVVLLLEEGRKAVARRLALPRTGTDGHGSPGSPRPGPAATPGSGTAWTRGWPRRPLGSTGKPGHDRAGPEAPG